MGIMFRLILASLAVAAASEMAPESTELRPRRSSHTTKRRARPTRRHTTRKTRLGARGHGIRKTAVRRTIIGGHPGTWTPRHLRRTRGRVIIGGNRSTWAPTRRVHVLGGSSRTWTPRHLIVRGRPTFRTIRVGKQFALTGATQRWGAGKVRSVRWVWTYPHGRVTERRQAR